MTELLLLSGKGGTGKTSVAGSFAALAGDSVLVDCDVDAANLHLLFNRRELTREEFRASRKASIDLASCTGCGRCEAACRFGAINRLAVDAISCEGCGACAVVCPHGAIRLEEVVSGHWRLSETPHGPLFDAELRPGEGNSGRLVSLLREKARMLAQDTERKLIICDGPPGLGCPVKASLAGVSLVLIVLEPSISSVHDFRRLLRVCQAFRAKIGVLINKSDLNPTIAKRIERNCRQEGIPVVGRIPVDLDITRATVEGSPVVEWSEGPGATAIREIWRKLWSGYWPDLSEIDDPA